MLNENKIYDEKLKCWKKTFTDENGNVKASVSIFADKEETDFSKSLIVYNREYEGKKERVTSNNGEWESYEVTDNENTWSFKNIQNDDVMSVAAWHETATTKSSRAYDKEGKVLTIDKYNSNKELIGATQINNDKAVYTDYKTHTEKEVSLPENLDACPKIPAYNLSNPYDEQKFELEVLYNLPPGFFYDLSRDEFRDVGCYAKEMGTLSSEELRKGVQHCKDIVLQDMTLVHGLRLPALTKEEQEHDEQLRRNSEELVRLRSEARQYGIELDLTKGYSVEEVKKIYEDELAKLNTPSKEEPKEDKKTESLEETQPETKGTFGENVSTNMNEKENKADGSFKEITPESEKENIGEIGTDNTVHPEDEEKHNKEKVNFKRWFDSFNIDSSLQSPMFPTPFAPFAKVSTTNRGHDSYMFNGGSSMIDVEGTIIYNSKPDKDGKNKITLEEAMTLVRAGQMKGWTSCDLTGSDEYKATMFAACMALGMRVDGYVPTQEAMKLAKTAEDAYNRSEPTLKQRSEDFDLRFPSMDSYAKGVDPSVETVSKAIRNGCGCPFAYYRDDLNGLLAQKEEAEAIKIAEEREENHKKVKGLELPTLVVTKSQEGATPEENRKQLESDFKKYENSMNQYQRDKSAEIENQISDNIHKDFDRIRKMSPDEPRSEFDEKRYTQMKQWEAYCDDKNLNSKTAMITKEFYLAEDTKQSETQKRNVSYFCYKVRSDTVDAALSHIKEGTIKQGFAMGKPKFGIEDVHAENEPANNMKKIGDTLSRSKGKMFNLYQKSLEAENKNTQQNVDVAVLQKAIDSKEH